MSRKPKVLVAMSGGVDSSVAAALLMRDGYDVMGCFMRLGSPGESLDQLDLLIEAASDERARASEEDAGQCTSTGCNTKKLKIGHQGCCSINDAQDARRVAGILGIPLYVCNFKRDFGRIIDYFVSDYNAGRTPNPCVRCNDWLKFGKLFDHARALGAEFVATGHYARVRTDSDSNGEKRTRLLRGLDDDKDQSYVLFGLKPDLLAKVMLPIGEMRKSAVRALAEEFGLPVASKPDSQEICFVPDNDYAGLVKRRSPERVQPGRIMDTHGNEIGEHPGHQHFTIGQRRGIGVALGHPIYVVNKDASTNTITIGDREDLLAGGCIASEANWHAPGSSDWRRCTAKIRYNSEPASARVRSIGAGEIEVEFEAPQQAVAAGQAVVCYEADEVIVGGWISRAMSIA
jgi:tRNA-specific 2-thiouridylase